MRRNHTDLLVVGVLAVVAAAAGALSGERSNIVQAVLSLPLVLFLPGYALSAALLPDGRTGLAERIAFSLGLSIAVAALGGLVLNRLPGGLNPGSWRLMLLALTLGAAGFAYWRRGRDGVMGPGPLATQISMREAALFSAAALVIGLALGLERARRRSVEPQRAGRGAVYAAVGAPGAERTTGRREGWARES